MPEFRFGSLMVSQKKSESSSQSEECQRPKISPMVMCRALMGNNGTINSFINQVSVMELTER